MLTEDQELWYQICRLTYGDASDDNLGIMTTLCFQYRNTSN